MFMNMTNKKQNNLALTIIIYAVFAAIIFFCHTKLEMYGDDILFAERISNFSLIDFLQLRYNTWSSRLVIEVILVFLCNNFWLWKILDTLILCLTCYSITTIIFNNKNVSNTIVVMLFMFIIPYSVMGETGWCATALNYSWVIAAILFCFIPLKKLINKQAIPKWTIPFYIIASLYAVNQEQGAVIVFCVSLTFVVYLIKTKQKSFYPYILLAISIISLIFIATCPGNHIRKLEEVGRWMPCYNDLSIFQKIYISTMELSSTLFTGTSIIILYALALFLYSIIFHKKMFQKIFSAAFLLLALFIMICKAYSLKTGTSFTFLNFWQNNSNTFQTSMFTINDWFKGSTIISFLFIIGSIIIPLVNLKKDSLLIIFILLIGYATRTILLFSPSVISSGIRPSIFMFYSFIITSLLIISKYIFKKSNNNFYILYISVLSIAAVHTFENYIMLLF